MQTEATPHPYSATPICFEPIGVVHSPVRSLDQLPRQPWYAPEAEGWIEVFPQYEEGLHLIERRRWILVVSYLHRADVRKMLVVPDGAKEPIGVFGARASYRPNPIAVSRMELVGRDGTRLNVRQIDLLDGTPVLDIKTYIERRQGE